MRPLCASLPLALALLFFGCGDDDSSPAGPTRVSPASPPVGGASAFSAPVGGASAPSASPGPARRVSSAVPPRRMAGTIRDFDAFLDERGRIAFSWRPPEDDRDVIAYAVFEQSNQVIEAELSPADICDEQSCAWVLGWRTNGAYSFGAAAVNLYGDGPQGRDSITLNVALPPAVEDLDGLQLVDEDPFNNVRIRWNHVLKNGTPDPAIIEYEAIHASRTFTIAPADCTPSGPWSCSVLFEALSLDPHVFTVRARNSAGIGTADVRTIDVLAPGAQADLTAEWRDVPVRHSRLATLRLKLVFSEDLRLSFRTLRDHSLLVSGGRLARVRRVTRGSNREWWVRVNPDAVLTDVVVEVRGRLACSQTGAICTEDGRELSNSPVIVLSSVPR